MPKAWERYSLKKQFLLLKAPVNRSEIPKDPSQMWVQCCAMLYDVAPPLNPPTEFTQKRPKGFRSLDAQDINFETATGDDVAFIFLHLIEMMRDIGERLHVLWELNWAAMS